MDGTSPGRTLWYAQGMRRPRWLEKGHPPAKPKQNVAPPWPSNVVLLSAPVGPVSSVGVEEIPYRRPNGSETVVKVVNFDRDAIFAYCVDELRRSIRWDGESAQVLIEDAEKARVLGRILYSKLHPDIGTVTAGDDAGSAHGGHQFGSLGQRRVSLRLMMHSLQDNAVGFDDRHALAAKHGPTSEGARQIVRKTGVQFLASHRSFEEWKLHFNFPIVIDLPAQADLASASRFLDNVAAKIATEEERLRQGRPRLGAWPATKDGRVPEAVYNRLRSSLKSMLKAAGYEQGGAVDHAATLISYYDAIEMQDRAAREVLARLPAQLLPPFDMRVFGFMWLAESGQDERGRYDTPIMASPPLASLLASLLDRHARSGRKRSWLDDLLWYIESGNASSAVEEMVGWFGNYPVWLLEERERDRNRKRGSLPESVDGWARNHDDAKDADADASDTDAAANDRREGSLDEPGE